MRTDSAGQVRCPQKKKERKTQFDLLSTKVDETIETTLIPSKDKQNRVLFVIVGATPDGTFESGKRGNQKKLVKGNF